jgi:ribonucleoside-diphosphate reductase alpha chain
MLTVDARVDALPLSVVPPADRLTQWMAALEDRVLGFPTLTSNAHFVLQRRILLKDSDGEVAETFDALCQRVSRHVAKGASSRHEEWQALYYDMIRQLDFMPNSPCLTNAGKKGMSLAACFVLPCNDSIEDIFDTVKNAALIHKAGGGTGMSGARLRPRGAIVGSTGGVASGPVSLLFQVVNDATEQIKQGSTRRGANMGILPVWHPDCLHFIRYKLVDGRLKNFNISVAITDEFMRALESSPSSPHLCHFRDARYWVDKNAVSHLLLADEPPPEALTTRQLWDEIVRNAHKNGEPGLFFIDEANRKNAALADPAVMTDPDYIEATNPCGEQPLPPFGACTLGSLNLANFVQVNGHADVDWPRLEARVRQGVRFLNGVIDTNYYPVAEIRTTTLRQRKIGLGVMGWADMLMRLGVPYTDSRAWEFGAKLATFIDAVAWDESFLVAKELGAYPGYKDTTFLRVHPELKSVAEKYGHGPANMAITSIAPTGTISTIAGCSSGIEPVFSWAFVQRRIDTESAQLHPLVEDVLGRDYCVELRVSAAEEYPKDVVRQVGFMNLTLIPQMHDQGPQYLIARDVPVQAHLEHQAAWQRHVTDAVSKTVVFPNSAKLEDVEKAYFWAWKAGLKGITVYREGSREGEVLSTGLEALKAEATVDATERPEVMPGLIIRDRVEVAPGESQNVYVSVGMKGATLEGGVPFEVFLAGDPKADPKIAQSIDSITRLTSTALRHGTPPNVVVQQLERIRGQHIHSMPRKIAQAILRAMEHTEDVPEGQKALLDRCSELVGNKPCGGQLVFMEGCYKCSKCNLTKCG